MINEHNYEEYFMMYIDNELDVQDKNAVDNFLQENPDLKPMLEELADLKLSPDDAIVFVDKDRLYNATSVKRIVPNFKWWHAAAVLILVIGSLWLMPYEMDNNMAVSETDENTTKPINQPILNRETPQPVSPQPISEEKNESLAGTGSKKDANRPHEMLSKHAMAVQQNKETGRENNQIHTKINEDISTVVSPSTEVISIAVSAKPIQNNDDLSIRINHPQPDQPGIDILLDAATLSDSNEDDESFRPIQSIHSRKKQLVGMFKKAGRLVDKTINYASNIKRTEQVNVKVGKYEVVLK